MSIPTMDGVPLATAAEVRELRAGVEELRRQLRELRSRNGPDLARLAMAALQGGFASLTEEERASLAESEQEAREFFGRGRQDG